MSYWFYDSGKIYINYFFYLHEAVPLIKLMMLFDVLYQLAES